MIEYKYLIVDLEEDEPLFRVEKFLAEGWVPLREVPMPSSVGGNITRAHAPCCMILLCREKVSAPSTNSGSR